MKWFNWLKIAVSGLILFMLFKYVNINQVLLNINTVDWSYIILAALFFVLMLFMDFIRIHFAINYKDKILSIKETWEYFKPVWALSFCLPSRVGDLSWVFILKKKGLKFPNIIYILMLDLFFVYGIFGTLALFGINKFIFKIPQWIIFIPLIVLIISSFYMFINRQRFLIWLTSVFKVISQLTMIFFIVRALSLNGTFFDIMLIQCLVLLTSFFPLSIGGLGVREATYTLLLPKLGIESGAALLIALFNSAFTYITVFVFVLLTKKGVFNLWKKKA